MSYTHCTSTASCTVAENFDLKEYLTSLSDFIGNHFDDLPPDVQASLGDYDQDDVIAELNNYFRVSDGKLLIEFDSEEPNGDTSVWDWLCDQIRQDVMTSRFMQFNYSSYDSRDGMDSGTSYVSKEGQLISNDEIYSIVEQYIKSL